MSVLLENSNHTLGKRIIDREQPRYGVNKRCVYWRNFVRYNNWRVVDLLATNVTPEEEENVYEIILHGIEARMNERVLIGTLGAMRTNDDATQGYYLVK